MGGAQEFLPGDPDVTRLSLPAGREDGTAGSGLGRGTRGPASDIEITAQEILKTKELSAQILADNCGQSFEKVMKDFNRDHWMDAEESVSYGIVDAILK